MKETNKKPQKKIKNSAILENDPELLRIAIPRKGRLRKPTYDLLQKAGYVLSSDDKALSFIDRNAGVHFFFLRSEDIPVLIRKNIVDVGISGLDLVEEKGFSLKSLLDLPFGHCRLCVAGYEKARANFIARKEKNLGMDAPLRFVTSFPTIAKKHFDRANIQSECIEMTGSVEIMMALHEADAIVDLVESGETLRKNQLVVYETIKHYHCALLGLHTLEEKLKVEGHHKLQGVVSKTNKVSRRLQILEKLIKRLRGVAMAQEYSILEYNLPKRLLEKAESITPGFDAPTVSHLDDPTMVAVKVLLKKKAVLPAMDKLEELGASAIYEVHIKNFRL